MKKFGHWQRLFDLLLTSLGTVITAISYGYGFGTATRPGPGLYALFLGLSLSIFGVILFLMDLRKPEQIRLFGKGKIVVLLLMLATFCFWILLMPLLGYVIVTLLACIAFGKIMALEGWRKPLLVSAGTTFFMYLLFDVWMYIDLPRGLLK